MTWRVFTLFRTAAHVYGPRVVGLVLTGALDCGASGLATVKQRGGIAVVQDPSEAFCPEMPQALEELILRLLAKTPEERPASATAVHEALGAISSAARGRAGQPVHEGAHPLDPLPVTLLFTDLVNSTELLQRVGDEKAQHIFQAHHRMLKDAVAANGGHEVKWLGDGLMVAFPSAANAVRCAIAMQQAARRRVAGERLAIRVGLNVGEALREETDYFGTPVVVARRLCDRAEGGQVLCSAAVAHLLAGRQVFAFRELGNLELKGITAPVAACEVLYGGEEPGVVLRRMPFVGRSKEVARLRQALSEARAGNGGLVMMVGEAGIGKTRTVEEFAEEARTDQVLVLWGRCYEGEAARPYGPFAEAFTDYVRRAPVDALRDDLGLGAAPLTRIVPLLLERLPNVPEPVALQPEEERARLLDAAAQLLMALAARAPTLLVVDDLHWADHGTVAMLRHVARLAPRGRLLIVGACRDVEVDRQHPLTDALGALPRETSYEQITLAGLDTAGVQELLNTIGEQTMPLALSTAITKETSGNPFFIREVLLHLVEEGTLVRDGGRWTATVALGSMRIPDTVRQVIERRLGRLREPARRLLDVAAAFTETVRFEIASQVAGLEETPALDALDEVLALQLLKSTPDPNGYEFTHALMRHTVYGALSPPRRVRLHRRIAEAMEQLHGADERYAAEIAQHYHRSAALPGAERGVPYCIAAAQQAERSAAFADAAAFLRMALDLVSEHEARRPRLLAQLGLNLALALEDKPALAAICTAGALIERSEGKAAAAEYLSNGLGLLYEAGFLESAFEVARLGLQYAVDRRDAVWASFRAVGIIERALESPESADVHSDSPEHREIGELVAQLPMWWGFTWTFIRRDLKLDPEDIGVRVFWKGEYKESLAPLYKSATTWRQLGRIAREADNWATISRCHVALGDFTQAQEARRRAAALAARLPKGSIHTATLVGAEDEWRMATDEGWDEPMLNVGPGMSQTEERGIYRASVVAAIARTHARRGRIEPALRRLAAVIPALDRIPGWTENYTRIACDAAETLWFTERTDHIETIERNLREKVIVSDYRSPMSDARLAAARLCALQGRYDEARDWFAKARTVLDEQGARPLRAITDFDEAWMYLRRGIPGDRERAAPLLDAALQQFHALGMTGWIRRAERLRLSEGPEGPLSTSR